MWADEHVPSKDDDSYSPESTLERVENFNDKLTFKDVVFKVNKLAKA